MQKRLHKKLAFDIGFLQSIKSNGLNREKHYNRHKRRYTHIHTHIQSGLWGPKKDNFEKLNRDRIFINDISVIKVIKYSFSFFLSYGQADRKG